MNKSIWLSALCLTLSVGCANMRTAVHTNWLNRQTPTIAVLPFSGDEPFNEEFPDALVTELVNNGFSVMERSQVSQIMKEAHLQYTGAVDPTTLSRTGRLAGVDYIVIGSLTTRPVISAFEYLLGDGKETTQIDTVHLRWVGVENGQVLASVTYRNSRGGQLETIARKITESLNRRVQILAQSQKNNRAHEIQLTAFSPSHLKVVELSRR